MKYSVCPRSTVYRQMPRLPLAPPENYLHHNMARTLDRQEVEFDPVPKLQTDPFGMPIENAAVRWPGQLLPFVPVPRLHSPRQVFAPPEQLGSCDNLSFNPWHCIAEHRPLGNQSHARWRMCDELSKSRQRVNRKPHIEPAGDDVFTQPTVAE